MKALVLLSLLVACVFATINDPSYWAGHAEGSGTMTTFIRSTTGGINPDSLTSDYQEFLGLHPGDVIGVSVSNVDTFFAFWIHTQWGQAFYSRPNSDWYCKAGSPSGDWLDPNLNLDGWKSSNDLNVEFKTAADATLSEKRNRVPMHAFYMRYNSGTAGYYCRMQIPFNPSYTNTKVITSCTSEKLSMIGTEIKDFESFPLVSPPIYLNLWGQEIDRVEISKNGLIRFDGAMPDEHTTQFRTKSFIPDSNDTMWCYDNTPLTSGNDCGRLCTLAAWGALLEVGESGVYWEGLTNIDGDNVWVISGENLLYKDECMTEGDDKIDYQFKIWETNNIQTRIQVNIFNSGKSRLWSHGKNNDPAIGFSSCDGTWGHQIAIGGDSTPEDYQSQYGSYEDTCVEYILCNNGVYVDDEDNPGCQCGPRFYWNEDTRMCTPCQPNTWKDWVGNEPCEPCVRWSSFLPEWSNVNGMDDNQLCQCEPGFGGDASSNTNGQHEGFCEVCAGANNKTDQSNSLCVCEDDDRSKVDYTKNPGICECKAGYYGNAYRPQKCSECSIAEGDATGTYKRFDGNDVTCIACPAGSKAKENAATFCVCDSESQIWEWDSEESSTGSCIDCPDYATVTSGECTCPVNSKAIDGTCLCAPGYYADFINDPVELTCKQCTNDGTYKPDYGNINCSACSESEHKTHNDDHTSCVCMSEYGTNDDGATCQQCSTETDLRGANKTTKGNIPCTCLFPTSAELVSGSATTCTCKPGYTDADDDGTCQQCRDGYFKNDQGTQNCSKCSTNSSSSASYTYCLCDPGTFPTSETYTPPNCELCPVDTYKTQKENIECTICPEHSETLGETGSKAKTDCLCKRGFDGSNFTTGCKVCPEDTFKNRTGNFECDNCPPNTHSAEASITVSMCLCDLNFYFDTENQTCRQCGTNFYKDHLGNDASCQLCPDNSVASSDNRGLYSEKDSSISWETTGNWIEVTTEQLKQALIEFPWTEGVQYSFGETLFSFIQFETDHFKNLYTSIYNERFVYLYPLDSSTSSFDLWTEIPPQSFRYKIDNDGDFKKLVVQFDGWLQNYGSSSSQWQATFYEDPNRGYVNMYFNAFQPICTSDVQSFIQQDSNSLCFLPTEGCSVNANPANDPESFPLGGWRIYQRHPKPQCTCVGTNNVLVFDSSSSTWKCMCEAGYNSSFSTNCTQCPENYITEEINLYPTCTPCPDRYVSNTDRTACQCSLNVDDSELGCTCDIGKEYDSDSESCNVCGADFAKREIGDGPCINCTSAYQHRVANADHSECVCDIGYYLNDGECTECPQRSEKTSIGNQFCTCSEASEVISSDGTVCLCATGYEGENGQCVPCQLGKAKSQAGDNDTAICVDCEIGFYSDSIGQKKCNSCPDSSTTLEKGSNSSDLCLCIPGYEYETKCNDCPIDEFKNTLSNDLCETCPDNSGHHLFSRTSVDSCGCESGFGTSTLPNCTQCNASIGEYKFYKGNGSCEQCPNNMKAKTSVTREIDISEITFSQYSAPTSVNCTPPPGSTLYCVYQTQVDEGFIGEALSFDTVSFGVGDLEVDLKIYASSTGDYIEVEVPFLFPIVNQVSSYFSSDVDSINIQIDLAFQALPETTISLFFIIFRDPKLSKIEFHLTNPTSLNFVSGLFANYNSDLESVYRQASLFTDQDWFVYGQNDVSFGLAKLGYVNGYGFGDKMFSSGNVAFQILFNSYSDPCFCDSSSDKYYLYNDECLRCPTPTCGQSTCGSNQKFDPESARCLCMPGFFNDSGVCTTCPSGSVNPDIDGSCFNCSTPKVANSDQTACICPNNMIPDGTGCTTCSGGGVSTVTQKCDCYEWFAFDDNEDTTCTCMPGFYGYADKANYDNNNKDGWCSRCPENTFKNSYENGDSADVCQSCPTNSIIDPSLSTPPNSIDFCLCNVDYGGDASSGTACTQCSGGSKNEIGNYDCSCKDQNSDASVDGGTCMCLPGYGGNAISSSCSLCPTSTYKSDYGNNNCTSCPDGSFSDVTGETTPENCVCKSDFGGFGNNETGCSECVLGSKPVGDGSCECVSNSTFVNISTCFCIPGYGNNGENHCDECGPGTYGPGNSDPCVSCPAHSTDDLYGETTLDNCECQAGYGGDATTSEGCTECPPGTEKPDIGNTECTDISDYVPSSQQIPSSQQVSGDSQSAGDDSDSDGESLDSASSLAPILFLIAFAFLF